MEHIDKADRPFIVCPTCEGHGTHGPGHVHTTEDRDEMGAEEFDDLMRMYRDHAFDVPCEQCRGARVTHAECPCTDCAQERFEITEMEAMERAERAFGC